MENEILTKLNTESVLIKNIDCREGFKLLEESSVDYVFTSPPYGRKANDKYKLFDDTMDWYELISMTIDESLRVLKDDGYLILNVQKTKYNKKDYFKILGNYSEYIVEEIVWLKSNPMPANGLGVTNGYEVFIVINKKGKNIQANKSYTKNYFMTSVNRYKYKGHRAIMSIDACRHMFNSFIKEGSIVLDCFSGLATTGLVCLENKCKYIGFELVEEYYKDSLERIEEHKLILNNN